MARSPIPVVIAAVVAAVLVGGVAVEPVEAQRRGRGGQASPPAERRDRVKKKIRKLRAVILVDELELDETTAARLFPILAKFDDEFARLARENLALRRALDDADRAGDDDAIDDAIDDLVANQRARWDLDEARFQAVRKVLTPRQAARILVVLPEIDRRVLEGARRAVEGTGKGKRGKAGARRRAPLDDEVEDPFGDE